ncbi:alpha/beta hydrolase fold domain-containing protein [Paraburkholderia phymatum]|uniref:alpha/beta hydrolase fold domain-containing protein n=2 Tax=Paraburkholderia phymatum TaxID=148447 RepID=UPI0000E78F11
MPSQEFRDFNARLFAHPASFETIKDPVKLREAFAAMNGEPTVCPDVTIASVDANGVPGEWVEIAGSDPSRVVLFLHGGGYMFGSTATHRPLVVALSRETRVRGFSIDYRLAPEHPFPAAVEDAVRGYQWLLAQRIDPARIVIAGDSAGGGLTVATLVSLRDQGLPLPAAGSRQQECACHLGPTSHCKASRRRPGPA